MSITIAHIPGILRDAFFMTLVALPLAVGVGVLGDMCRWQLARCNLFPLPLLRRWKQRFPLLNRPSMAGMFAWQAVVFLVLYMLNFWPSPPSTHLLTDRTLDTSLAVPLGFIFGLGYRHLGPYDPEIEAL